MFLTYFKRNICDSISIRNSHLMNFPFGIFTSELSWWKTYFSVVKRHTNHPRIKNKLCYEKLLKMENIQDVSIETCSESKYLRPYRLRYKQNGREKIWDIMDTGDSVSILVYNPFRKVFIFVKQFRPAVYSCNSNKFEENGVKKIDPEKYPGKLGVTYELCAGLVDKDCSVIEIAQQELLEELGYKVPLYKIEKVTTFRSGVGASGNLQTMFYTEVSDVMKVSAGGGLESEGELIETVEVPVSKGREIIYDESINKPAGMMFALLWFYENKYKPS